MFFLLFKVTLKASDNAPLTFNCLLVMTRYLDCIILKKTAFSQLCKLVEVNVKVSQGIDQFLDWIFISKIHRVFHGIYTF